MRGRRAGPDPVGVPAGADERAGGEMGQRQAAQAAGAAQFGVGGVEQLGPVVEPEAVDGVGGHPPADAFGGLQDGDAQAPFGQMVCGGQARRARADDDHIRGGGHAFRACW